MLGVFFFQAEDGIRDGHVTGVQTCALPIWNSAAARNPMPAARNATMRSGTPASSATTRRSDLRETPVRRSRLKGRLRSATPAVTLTARLQPATTRLIRITTLLSCCNSVMVRVLAELISLSVVGGPL